MIINSIRAWNVLKYTELKLENMPEKGIIAISGHNESGKSTIGETMCFALFGRTFSLNPTEIAKLIRWGEDNCTVIVNFTVDTHEYSLYRYLDTEGNHSARLSLQGHEEAPIARSPLQVAEVLENILGFTFDEFIESFYLAQREITSPHPHGRAVKSIAGVYALEQVSKSYEQDVIEQNEVLDVLEEKQAALREELDDLALEEGYLQTLDKEYIKTETDLKNTQQLADDLQNNSDNYLANDVPVKWATAKRKRSRFWSVFSLLLAMAAAGMWAMLTYQADLPLAVALQQQLSLNVPGWQAGYLNIIGIAGAVFAVLFLVLLIRSAAHNKRVKALCAESANLAGVMEQVRLIAEYERVAETAEELDEDDLQPEQEITEPENVIHRYEKDKYASLQPAVRDANAATGDVANYTEIEQRWLAEQIKLRKMLLDHLHQLIMEERSRVNHAEGLHHELSTIQERIDNISAELASWKKAIELLAGASKHFSSKFNRNISELMSMILPVFTQGRYEHLQIEPGLGVRVFSNDKRDYLDMDEISSGTQRQIMLALRIAMAQKLMGSTVKGRQFAFLDEPFAFFDEERTKHALSALHELSDAISQIWIVSQSFPDGQHEFAAEIKCTGELNELYLDAKHQSGRDFINEALKADIEEPELADTDA